MTEDASTIVPAADEVARVAAILRHHIKLSARSGEESIAKFFVAGIGNAASAIAAMRPASTEAELVGALEPFAQSAAYYDMRIADDGSELGPYPDNAVAGVGGIQVRHYRAARAALARAKGQQ